MDQYLAHILARRCRFCGWAREYESDGLSRLLGVYQQQALDVLRPTQQDILLDVGCGTRAAIRRAAFTVQQAIGVDACPRMIDRAQQLGAGLKRAGFVVAVTERLPFADGVFTALLCTAVLRHVSDRTAVAREMARVLRPGGRVVLGDFVPELRRTGIHAARRLDIEAATVPLSRADLRIGSNIVCSTPLGPYLITHATKACRNSRHRTGAAARSGLTIGGR